MKLFDIIAELTFFTYSGMVQVIYDKETSATEISELFRALPGVTTVTIAGQDASERKITMKIKLISQKPGTEAFEAMKANALSKYQRVSTVIIANNTIEKK